MYAYYLIKLMKFITKSIHLGNLKEVAFVRACVCVSSENGVSAWVNLLTNDICDEYARFIRYVEHPSTQI